MAILGRGFFLAGLGSAEEAAALSLWIWAGDLPDG